MGNAAIGNIEFYAGYRGGETPRSVTVAGIRHEVARVESRGRVLDPASGNFFEVFLCVLDNGRKISLKRPTA